MVASPSKKQEIITFAQKYIAFFEKEFGSDESKFRFFDGNDFPLTCDDLGFKMDCGESFTKVDEESWFKVEVLKGNVDKFTDINILGSGLYSQWRSFNHWGSPLDATEDTKEWFIILLRRLVTLCTQDCY